MDNVIEYGKAQPRRTPWRILRWSAIILLTTVAGFFLFNRASIWLAGWEGRAEANRDWAAGKATLYHAGYFDFANTVDDATGLPWQPIAGCTDVTDAVVARLGAHNQRMRELIALHGAPANSWLTREPGVCNLIQQWKDRTARGEIPVMLNNKINVPVNVTSGTSGYAHSVCDYAGLEIDGALFRTMHPYSPTENLAALGGVKDENVIYFRGTSFEGKPVYFAIEAGGACLRYEREETP